MWRHQKLKMLNDLSFFTENRLNWDIIKHKILQFIAILALPMLEHANSRARYLDRWWNLSVLQGTVSWIQEHGLMRPFQTSFFCGYEYTADLKTIHSSSTFNSSSDLFYVRSTYVPDGIFFLVCLFKSSLPHHPAFMSICFQRNEEDFPFLSNILFLVQILNNWFFLSFSFILGSRT